MKKGVIFMVVLSIFLLVGCSNGKRVSMNLDSENEILEELEFSKGSYFGTEIKMVDNKNEIVANYIEILNKDGLLEGYIISDYVTGKVHEYASGGSVLFDLVSKANLDMEIVRNNPVYYAGPFTIIVTDDEGNVYNLMGSEDNVGELISKEDLDSIFNDKNIEFGK